MEALEEKELSRPSSPELEGYTRPHGRMPRANAPVNSRETASRLGTRSFVGETPNTAKAASRLAGAERDKWDKPDRATPKGNHPKMWPASQIRFRSAASPPTRHDTFRFLSLSLSTANQDTTATCKHGSFNVS